MAGLVPLQIGSATNGSTGPLASLAGDAQPLAGFAAVLSSLVKSGTWPRTPAEAVRVSDPGFTDTGNGLDPTGSAATGPFDLLPVAPEADLATPLPTPAKPSANAGTSPEIPRAIAMKSSDLVRFNPVVGKAATSPARGKPPGAKPADSASASDVNGLPQSPTGSAAPKPVPADSAGDLTASDRAGPEQDVLTSGEIVQTPAEDANSHTGLLSQAVLAMPRGTTKGVDPQQPASRQLLPVATSGKNSDGAGRHTIRGHRLAGQHRGPEGKDQVSQGLAVVTVTAVASTSQPPPASVTPQVSVTPTLPSDPLIAVTPQTKVADSDPPGDPQRPASVDPAPVDPARPQSTGEDHAARVATPVAPIQTASGQEQAAAVKFADVPGAPAPGIRVDVPPAVVSGAASSPASSAGKAQPAAPALQIAPALIGILQQPDGQQSVTVRLQPAELGQVQIRIDQTVAGAAHIDITAERPETLQLLQRDEPRLQQVLDQAGIQSTGRTVSFQMSAPEQIVATAARPDSMQTGTGASGQGQNGGTWRQNGDSPNEFGRSPNPDQGQNRPRWFRAGLDITA